MKRILTMLAISVFSLTSACVATADKEQPKEETVMVPVKVVQGMYAYLSNFPAKEVLPIMRSIESQVSPYLDKKEANALIKKSEVEAVNALLMKDKTVQMTIAIQKLLADNKAEKEGEGK